MGAPCATPLAGAAAVVAFHGSVAAEVEATVPALAGRIQVVPQSVQFPPPGAAAAPAIGGDPCVLFPAGIRAGEAPADCR